MLKQLSINSSKGIFKTYKANILKNIEQKFKYSVKYCRNIEVKYVIM